MSTDTAAATTTNDTTIDSVADQMPVDRLDQTVNGVKTAVGNLVGQQELPESTGRAGADREEAVTAPVDRSTRPAKAALDDGVDRLSRLAVAFEDLDVSARDIADGSVAPADLVVAVPVGAQALGDVAGTVPSRAAPSTTASPSKTEAQGPGEATRGHERATHTAASAVEPGKDAGTSVDDQGDGELPLAPVGTGALGKTPATGSSAGGNVIDGGAGARVTAFHLPFVARAVMQPSVLDVEVSWNSAGKPRVSPD